MNISHDDISLHETSLDDMLLFPSAVTTPRRDYEGEKRKRVNVNVMPSCMHCDVSHPFHKMNLNPLIFKQKSEIFQKQKKFQTKAQDATKKTSANQFAMQQEDKYTQTAESLSETPLDRIQRMVDNGQKISPIIFSKLLNLVRIRDTHYTQILKILSRSCQLMNKNPPQLIRKFFTSKQFLQQFIQTNMIVDEIRMLRKSYAEKIQEWKVMHREVFIFRSMLLRFLEKQFGRGWTQNLIEKAEEQRIRIWPLSSL